MTQTPQPETPEHPASPAIDLQPLTPVTETERVTSIDILRGFAVLGILAINIQMMAYPQGAMMNPTLMGEPGLLTKLAWGAVTILFLQKFLSIFSLLFGAGVIIMWHRAEATGRRATPLHYRRMGWLVVIGLVHAYLFWWGDILFSYALCGMIVFLFRRFSPRKLLIIGLLVLLVPTPFAAGLSALVNHIQSQVETATLKLEAGDTPTDQEQMWYDTWQNIGASMSPTAEQIQSDIDNHTGGYGDLFAHRAGTAIMLQTLILIFYVAWRVCGLMLIGMALMKWRVLVAERSRSFYLRMVIFGLGIGLPLDIYGVSSLMSGGFDPGSQILVGSLINYLASVFSAGGYIGLVMLACQSNILTTLKTRLAAVGRMALTNYLMHTLVFTTVFYGYGFGLYGALDLLTLLLLMLAMWILQLYFSPLWLRHFRFGPVEWLWRSLTYKSAQPLRRLPNRSSTALGA